MPTMVKFSIKQMCNVLFCHLTVPILRGLRPGPQHFKKRAASLLQSRCQWVRRRTSRLKSMSSPGRTTVHTSCSQARGRGRRTRSGGRQINPISGTIGPSYFECTSHDVVHERALVVVVVPLVNIVRLRGSCVMAWNATAAAHFEVVEKAQGGDSQKIKFAIIWLLSYASISVSFKVRYDWEWRFKS